MKIDFILPLNMKIKKGTISLALFFLCMLSNNPVEGQSLEYGLMSSDGKTATPLAYQSIENKGLAFTNYFYGQFKQYGKFGLMDSLGKTLLPPVYFDLQIYPNINVVAVKKEKEGKWGFVTSAGKELTQYKYDQCAPLAKASIILVKQEQYWGAIDTAGQEIIPCIYNKIGNIKGLFAIITKDGKQGVITNTGRIVIPLGLPNIEIYSGEYNSKEYLCEVLIDGTSGLIDTTGNVLVPFENTRISFSGKNLGDVSKTDKTSNKYTHALLSPTGQFVTPFIYDDVTVFQTKGGAIAVKDGIYNYLDSLGTVRITSSKEIKRDDYLYVYENKGYSRYDYDGSFLDSANTEPPALFWDYLRDDKQELFGFHDGWGRVVIPPMYKEIARFENSDYTAAKNEQNRWGIINKQNETIVPFKYDFTKILSKNRFILQWKGKQAISDLNGYRLTTFKYNKVEKILDDYFSFKRNSFYGTCSNNGEEIVLSMYDKIEIYSSRCFFVTKKNKKGIVRMIDGMYIVPCIYDNFKIESERILAQRDEKWGIVDIDLEKEIIPCIYDEIRIIGEGKTTITARKANLWGIIDEKGNELTPFTYNEIKPYHNNLLIVSKNRESANSLTH